MTTAPWQRPEMRRSAEWKAREIEVDAAFRQGVAVGLILGVIIVLGIQGVL